MFATSECGGLRCPRGAWTPRADPSMVGRDVMSRELYAGLWGMNSPNWRGKPTWAGGWRGDLKWYLRCGRGPRDRTRAPTGSRSPWREAHGDLHLRLHLPVVGDGHHLELFVVRAVRVHLEGVLVVVHLPPDHARLAHLAGGRVGHLADPVDDV